MAAMAPREGSDRESDGVTCAHRDCRGAAIARLAMTANAPRIAMRASVQALLFALVAGGAPSAIAQGDAAAAKRNPAYGLDARTASSEGLRWLDTGFRIRTMTSAGIRRRGQTARGNAPASGAIVNPGGVTKK